MICGLVLLHSVKDLRVIAHAAEWISSGKTYEATKKSAYAGIRFFADPGLIHTIPRADQLQLVNVGSNVRLTLDSLCNNITGSAPPDAIAGTPGGITIIMRTTDGAFH